MIFSKFFKAKWQNKDSNIRISAINDELAINVVEDKDILMTLLQEDENELVRRSVLLKINDFNIWLSASIENTNKKIREYALRQVEKILLGQSSIILSVDEKLTFITEHNNNALLEALLKIESNDELIIALFHKLDKPRLVHSLFKEKKSEVVQLFLVEKIDQKEALEKLLKFSASDKVTVVIENKIAALTNAELKPIKIKKQVQLILAKFLALKDIVDYKDVLNKRVNIVAEWQSIEEELNCLSDDEVNLFNTKYQDIESQLSKVFVKKAEFYEQQLIEEKLLKDKTSDKEQFSLLINEHAHLVTTAIFENNEINEQEFNEKLDNIEQSLTNSVLNENEKKPFFSQLVKLREQLGKLPEIAQSVTEATHLVSKISQVALPTTTDELNEKSAIYNDWLGQWKQLNKKSSGILPDSIVNAYQQVVSQWDNALKPLLKEQSNKVHLAKKKLADVGRLISQGKFNAAFGVFKKAEHFYLQLSQSQQVRIQRDFDNIKEKIADLSDLEHFIATPRKQKLLEQVNELVVNPLDNPNEQASKVKAFRKTWNSLGHADDDVEKTLNDEFNLACEQAFAPCRLFFSEQEKLRELHLVTRTALINSAKNLTESIEEDSVNFKAIDAELIKLQQQWRDAGEVDRNVYKELNSEFSKALKPVKLKVAGFHQTNTDQKQQLIEKAVLLSQLDDVHQAINQVKELQRQWKTIGYCGKHTENTLWQKFRTINDDIFSKRQALQSVEKEEQAKLTNLLKDQLDNLATQIKESSSIAEFEQCKAQVSEIKIQAEQGKLRDNKLFKVMSELTTELVEAVEQAKEKKENEKWLNLFTCFENMSHLEHNVENSSEYSALPTVWKKQIGDVLTNTSPVDRSVKTLELEIIAGVESPAEFKAERMTVQVSLMKEQMSSGHRITNEQALVEWLGLGALSEQDSSFIARLKPIYCY